MAKILLYTVHDNACSGIRVLGAYLQSKGHDVKLFFFGTPLGVTVSKHLDPGSLPNNVINEDLTFIVHSSGEINLPEADSDITIPNVFLDFIAEWQPDIIGYSGRSILDPYFQDWFYKMREQAPNALLIAGGFGPTLAPEIYLKRGADCVVRNEGELALEELARCVDAKEAWQHINNLTYLEDGVVKTNPLGAIIENLDTLPPQLKFSSNIYHITDNILLQEDPLPPGGENRCFLSRGCVGTCSYCSAGHWHDAYRNEHIPVPKYRYPSNDAVIKMFQFMKSQGAKAIGMEDDYFIRPYALMKDLLTRFKSEVGLPFFAYFHPIFLKKHPDIIPLAIDSGLGQINLPIQSADPIVNKEIFHRQTDLEMVLEYAHFAVSRYITFVTHFIDGFNAKSLDLDDYFNKNISFIRKLPAFNPGFPNLVRFSVSYLRLYSNSPMYKQKSTTRMNPKKFFYRAMLMLFRYIMDDKEYGKLLQDKYCRQNPEIMLDLYNQTRLASHQKYMHAKSSEFAGADALVWGYGEVYNMRKPLFTDINVKAIVVDTKIKDRKAVGLPILHVRDAIDNFGQSLPIFICIKDAQICARKLKKMFPDYPDELIIGYGVV